jgi:hypothetical protein
MCFGYYHAINIYNQEVNMSVEAEAQDYDTSALGLGQVLEGSVSEDQVGLNVCYLLYFCYF